MCLAFSTSLFYASFSLLNMRCAPQTGEQLEHPSRCLDNRGFPALFFIFILCSNTLSLKHRPLCPIYTWPQSTGSSYTMHFWYGMAGSVVLLTSCPLSTMLSSIMRIEILCRCSQDHTYSCNELAPSTGDLKVDPFPRH